jgi:Tetratricopeptide repeat
MGFECRFFQNGPCTLGSQFSFFALSMSFEGFQCGWSRNTATNLTNLALLYDNQQRYNDAEPLYRRAISIREKVFGSGHPDRTFSIRSYVALLRKLGRDDEAQTLESRLRGTGG